MQLQKYLNDKRAGFTLVELIVVLVILAILAAILVPTLTGYIKQAQQQRFYPAAENVREAAQAVADSQIANNYKGNASRKDTIDVYDRTASGQTVFDLTGMERGDAPNKLHGFYLNENAQGQITSGVVEFCDGQTYWYRYWLNTDNTWRFEDYSMHLKGK